MCNMRRLALYLFLALAGGLIPLTDADACRRGRCVRGCGSTTDCATFTEMAEHHRVGALASVTPPVVKGSLYDTNGMLLTSASVTIAIFNSTPVQIGSVTTSTGNYLFTMGTSPPTGYVTGATLNADGKMTITYKRSGGMGTLTVPAG